MGFAVVINLIEILVSKYKNPHSFKLLFNKGLAGFLVRMTDIVEVQLFELKLIL